MVEQVTMYKAKNGVLFPSREEAEQSERDFDLKCFLENILEPHIHYGKVDYEEVINELVAHADELRAILPGITVEEEPSGQFAFMLPCPRCGSNDLCDCTGLD